LEERTTITVKFSSNYVPYGSNYAMTGKEVFMYTGQPYSSVTGLYYFGARYYDPTIGRFITEDSYEGDDNDPMTLNRYIYGRDNPERYSDPNGHWYVVSTGGGGAVSPTCTGSPDACLTRSGNYQYSNPTPSSTPPSTTTTTTTTHTVTSTTETYESTETETTTTTTATISPDGEIKAVTLTLGVADVTIFLAVGTAICFGAAPEDLGTTIPAGVVLGGLSVAGGSATVSMAEYDIQYYPNATPQGALQAGGNSFIISVIKQVISILPIW
jgi:RHS repeat-associated protein